MTTKSALAAMLADLPELQTGHVWLIGAGPGHMGHLTLLAVAGLQAAEVVVFDALVGPDILALAPAEALMIDAGKRGGKPSALQGDITDTLILHARAGKRVVRLKGGDPYIFGRGGEEALALAAGGIAFRVVPGLTSGLAGLATAHIPATMRHINQAVILATGHGAERSDGLDWAVLAQTGLPIILYMAMANLETIANRLMAGGLAGDTPAAIVMSACTEDERVLISTLDRLVADSLAADFGSPAITVIGRNALVREEILALIKSTEQQS